MTPEIQKEYDELMSMDLRVKLIGVKDGHGAYSVPRMGRSDLNISRAKLYRSCGGLNLNSDGISSATIDYLRIGRYYGYYGEARDYFGRRIIPINEYHLLQDIII